MMGSSLCKGGLPALLALIVLAPVGCGPGGDDLPREAISGSVTFDGEPIRSGTIQFHPVSQAEGMAAGGMIVDGRFNVPRHEGPVPGSYKVLIYSLDDEGPVFPPAPGEDPSADEAGDDAPDPADDAMPGELRVPDPRSMPRRGIPARYNAKTELLAQVKADEANTYTFDLEP
ncbi:hypothetical protein AB1L88_03750 [Tautonia sp. JC769]|uniref:hypothetical protein n=1 Tax=Tautonia sp. JC769 TaxID=3232135 RepID=UPI00345A81C2